LINLATATQMLASNYVVNSCLLILPNSLFRRYCHYFRGS